MSDATPPFERPPSTCGFNGAPACSEYRDRGGGVESRLAELECIVRRLTDAHKLMSQASSVALGSSEFADSSDEDKSTEDQIRTWLRTCIQGQRFCPKENGAFSPDSNVSCYVTSDTDDAAAGDAMLCVPKCKLAKNNLLLSIGQRIKLTYGQELKDTCHMGPEEEIYMNALVDLQRWEFDFRRLVGNHVFDSRRHLTKLGLLSDLPGIADHADVQATPSFVRVCSFPREEEEKAVQALGVNCWSLLLCVSLAQGPTLHPKISSDFSRTVLREILRWAPVSATPGNNILIRSFDLHTTAPQRIVVPSTSRPNHFLRPTNDLSFAMTGEFTIARAIGRFVPEDAMHCGFLFQMADTLECDIMDLPGDGVESSYELVANRDYAVWVPTTKSRGKLVAHGQSGKVRLEMYPCQPAGNENEPPEAADAYEEGPETWEDKLRDLGAILPPMIWRCGACVLLDGDGIGVITQYEGGCTFDPDALTYRVLSGSPDHVIHLPFQDVLRKLIRVGDTLCLRISADSWATLIPQVPSSWRQLKLLKVRLNVPTVRDPEPNRVYVTYIMRPTVSRTEASEVSSVTIAVHPWELVCDSEDNEAIPYLNHRRG